MIDIDEIMSSVMQKMPDQSTAFSELEMDAEMIGNMFGQALKDIGTVSADPDCEDQEKLLRRGTALLSALVSLRQLGIRL